MLNRADIMLNCHNLDDIAIISQVMSDALCQVQFVLCQVRLRARHVRIMSRHDGT